MTHRKATKSDAEREQEEAERLVRPSPKNKPPRRDKERGRIQPKDKDTDGKDRDLSLNYKDIGGETLAQRVSRLFMGAEFATEEAWDTYQEAHPGADRKDHVVKDSEEGGSEEDESAKDSEGEAEKPKNPRQLKIREEPEEADAGEESAEAASGDAGEEGEDDDAITDMERELLNEMRDNVPEVSGEEVVPDNIDDSRGEQRQVLIDTQAQAFRDSGASYDDLYDVGVSDDPDSVQAQAAQRVMMEQKASYPKGMDEMPEGFRGELDADTKKVLEDHASNWDVYDHDSALQDVSEKLTQAGFENNPVQRMYYEQVKSVFEGARARLRNLPSLGEENTLESLLPDKKALNALSDRGLVRQLNYDSPKLYQAALFSSQKDVDAGVAQLDALIKDSEKGSSAQKYYTELKEPLVSLSRKKAPDETTTYGRVLSRLEAASGDGLKPSEVDFTDEAQVSDFVEKIRKLSDKDLVELVKDEPGYRMALDIGPNTQAATAILEPAFKQRLMDELTADFLTKGYFEQLRLSPEEPGRARVFDPVQVKVYLTRRKKDQESTKTPEAVDSSFAAFFTSLLEDLMKSNKTAQAFSDGFTRALSRRNRVAQYRGLPGRLPVSERPPSPNWTLPSGSMSLLNEDYAEILSEAKVWLETDRLSFVRDMPGASEDSLYGTALDLGILTASGYRYAGMIDAPTYDRLLTILKRITT